MICRLSQSIRSLITFGYKGQRTNYCASCWREYTRNHRLKKLGVSREQWLATLADQLGACAVCGKQEHDTKDGKRGLHQDHDHATGKVRGILCSNCNQLLGRVGDSVIHLQGLIDYLHKWRRFPLWTRWADGLRGCAPPLVLIIEHRVDGVAVSRAASRFFRVERQRVSGHGRRVSGCRPAFPRQENFKVLPNFSPALSLGDICFHRMEIFA